MNVFVNIASLHTYLIGFVRKSRKMVGVAGPSASRTGIFHMLIACSFDWATMHNEGWIVFSVCIAQLVITSA
jgi:hypothetical protein